MEKYSSWHKNNQIILCICPKCKRISRFGELRIILTEKFPNTWRDDYDKKLTSFQAKEDEFSSKESAIRKEAIEKARKQLPKLIRQSLSDQITSLKFNPYDIKPILYPIDYVIYDGMEKGSIDNVIFLHNKNKNSKMRELHKSIHATVEKEEYDWKVARISLDGGLEIEEKKK